VRDRASPVGTYCGISCGPAGAFGFVNGCVASQATNATRYWGRKRFSATRIPFGSWSRYAVNQALNVLASAER